MNQVDSHSKNGKTSQAVTITHQIIVGSLLFVDDNLLTSITILF